MFKIFQTSVCHGSKKTISKPDYKIQALRHCDMPIHSKQYFMWIMLSPHFLPSATFLTVFRILTVLRGVRNQQNGSFANFIILTNSNLTYSK